MPPVGRHAIAAMHRLWERTRPFIAPRAYGNTYTQPRRIHAGRSLLRLTSPYSHCEQRYVASAAGKSVAPHSNANGRRATGGDRVSTPFALCVQHLDTVDFIQEEPTQRNHYMNHARRVICGRRRFVPQSNTRTVWTVARIFDSQPIPTRNAQLPLDSAEDPRG